MCLDPEATYRTELGGMLQRKVGSVQQRVSPEGVQMAKAVRTPG